MNLKDMIPRRRSCRSYTAGAVDAATLDAIRAFPMKPLYPGIPVHWDIVSRDRVRSICPWTTPQLIAVYSKEAPGYLENVGFMFQQLELYLHTLGLGVCWLGMGRMKPGTAPEKTGMKFVILLAFGHPTTQLLRRDGTQFRRKAPEQITDRPDPRLEPARLAPSSVNSQPWYFTHAGDALHVFCAGRGLLGDMNRIDMGIALAHLYVTNEDTFRFFRAKQSPSLPGHGYIGTVEL